MTRVRGMVERGALVLIAAMLAAAPALAQEGETPSAANAPVGWVFRWLNFAIVFGFFAFAFYKWAGPAFRQTAEQIAQAVGEAARAREAAEQRRKEVEAKIANVDSEISKMRDEAKRDAEAEAQRLKAQSKAEAERIEEIARGEIAAAERAARSELKRQAAEMALDRAEVLVKRDLTPKTEAALLEGFVAQLQGSVN
jgi:F-type H+-transporting ATPase subunit b